ncbi:MAG: hypothetical protein HC933_05010 [Pleurocapsa sp. SU_196_0]|nr:hypothetical protein [Pleurocapsa sp. SU_196_0]
MIVQVLEAISARIEAAGLRWGLPPSAWRFDGLSTERRVTWEPTDADHPRGENLKVGIAWNTPFVPRAWLPPFGLPKTREVNPTLGTLTLEAAAPNTARILRVHLYAKETRPDEARVGWDLPTMYMPNEERIVKALGGVLRQPVYETIPVPDGNNVNVSRTFAFGFDGSEYVNTAGLEAHGVYRVRVEYPMTEDLELTPGFIPIRINLITSEPVTPPRDLSNTPEPVTVSAPGRVTILENP